MFLSSLSSIGYSLADRLQSTVCVIGCVPRVQLATDSLTGTNDKHWPELRRIREFHDRLNRRIDEARRTLQDNYLFPHCTDQ